METKEQGRILRPQFEQAAPEAAPNTDEQNLQQAVLDRIQSGFPLARDPYGLLAADFATTREAVIDAIEVLFARGQVRRIGASFDSRTLGYTSTLCAVAVPGGEDELKRVADIVSTVPGVTHNYARDHHYNLWFTLITRSIEQRHAILEGIRTATGCDDILDLPSTRKYKISVDFGKQRAASQKQEAPALTSADRPAFHALCRHKETNLRPFDAQDAFDVELVRWAQEDIAHDGSGAFAADPYVAGAEQLNIALNREDISPETVIERLSQLKAARVIRRFGAMVRHQNIGFAYNAMTTWDIPDASADAAGELFAQAHFVSHCYTRPRAATWQTNLYAMVHATSEEELEAHISELAKALDDAGIECRFHDALDTTHEFKKVSMSYFQENENPFASTETTV